MITPGQTKMIHTAKRALGLSDEDYRDMLEERFGHRSSSDLTSNQARVFIDELIVKGFESAGAKIGKQVEGDRRQEKSKGKKNRPVMKDGKETPFVYVNPHNRWGIWHNDMHDKCVSLPSRDQLDFIDEMKALVIWREVNGFEKWLLKRFKLNKICTSRQAAAVIEALKRMSKDSLPEIRKSEKEIANG
jgi:hypothetical protein